jgi:hypothetical protein
LESNGKLWKRRLSRAKGVTCDILDLATL